MSDQTPANDMIPLSEYTKQPRGAYLVDRWRRNNAVETPHGNFSVEMVTDMDDTPDERMLQLASDCADYVQRNSDYIAEVVFGHLQWAIKDWGEDIVFTDEPFEGDPIPRDVTVGAVIRAYGGGEISVHYSRKYKSPYTSDIGFNIPFDPEHGLRLSYADGSIHEANDSKFNLVDGVMVHDWEDSK